MKRKEELGGNKNIDWDDYPRALGLELGPDRIATYSNARSIIRHYKNSLSVRLAYMFGRFRRRHVGRAEQGSGGGRGVKRSGRGNN